MLDQLSLRLLLCRTLPLTALAAVRSSCAAKECPASADEIATDRPDVSSLVVPFGSVQARNGADWSVRHGLTALDGTNTRLRFGVAHCIEVLSDASNCFGALNAPQPTGVSDVVASLKRQLTVPFGLDLSAAGFPSGARGISGCGHQPYIQFPWSPEIATGSQAAGVFELTWFPSPAPHNPTFEPTPSSERAFGQSADVSVEYVGDYGHQRPRQILGTGVAWRFTKTQQLDFHLGPGLSSGSVGHHFRIGYSFGCDGLFGELVGHSP